VYSAAVTLAYADQLLILTPLNTAGTSYDLRLKLFDYLRFVIHTIICQFRNFTFHAADCVG